MKTEPKMTMTPEKIKSLQTAQEIIAQRSLWLTVHGALCLALRHPHFTGPSREEIKSFVASLGKGLVDWGILSPDELELVNKTEAENSPHGQ